MSIANFISQIRGDIERGLLKDRHLLGRRLERLLRTRGGQQPTDDAAWLELAEAAQRSRERSERRLAQALDLQFPEDLPVSARREEIAAAIQAHPVVVLCGETGSGKSTQLPKICLEAGRGQAGLIGHTQPRRLAARTLATRIAAELRTELGGAVGFKVRFGDHVSELTRIKLMTDGVLLQETLSDRQLLAYDTLIIDEAHERSLNIDFLLGYLKRLLPERPDLKVIITSATLDPERIAAHFDQAPIIEVSGRSYPIELRYRPLMDPDRPDAPERDLVQAVVEAVQEADRLDRGDILIFLAGERDIRDVEDALKRCRLGDTDIRPLYSRLGAAEQNAIFAPHTRRHIVLATNVAETSVTVPGVRFVIDSGWVRLSRYSTRTKVQRLPIEPIARASADQRMGRCGRVGPGVCIRLYSEEDYLSRPPFTDPEILRTSLAAVILRLAALDFGRIENFPFIDMPDGRQVSDGYRLLEELGALDSARRLTPLGRELAKLPVDPRIGRMLLAAREYACLEEVLVIASALSIQDMRERPADQKQAADLAHGLFADERSDFLWFVNLWRAWQEQSRHLSKSKQRVWLKQHFLSALRMREWIEVHAQLLAQLHDMGIHFNTTEANYEAVHRALLRGLLGNVALLAEGHEYQGARNLKLAIFPGSTLARRRPRCIMAAELTETGRTYARTVAVVEPEWIEAAAGSLLRWQYGDPHWQRKTGRVVALATVSLFGLVLATGRRVDFGPIDPKLAREVFIRAALVEGDLDLEAPFLTHNAAAIEAIEALQHRYRRLDLLVDATTRHGFYAERIPDGIYDLKTFELWRKTAELANPQLLCMDPASLFRTETGLDLEIAFPMRWRGDGLELPLDYLYAPGDPQDGVTLIVPLAVLNQVQAERLDWLVPGLLQEKLESLLRGLPKSLRKALVPVPDTVRRWLPRLDPERGNLFEQLSGLYQAETGQPLSLQDLTAIELEAHLKLNLRVLDETGAVLAESRDLANLRERFGLAARAAATGPDLWTIARKDVLRFDIDALPEQVIQERMGYTVKGYPAFVDLGRTAGIEVFDTPEAALQALRAGLRRLIALGLEPQIAQLRKALPNVEVLCRQYKPLGGPEALRSQLTDAAVDRCFLAGPLPRTRLDFEALLQTGRPRLQDIAMRLTRLASEVLKHFDELQRLLAGPKPPAWLSAIADIQDQLKLLLPADFVLRYSDERLQHLPRYLKAIKARMERLKADAQKDRAKLLLILPWWEQARAGLEQVRTTPGEALLEYRWLVEEYRVSVFAQDLGTAAPVSPDRLKKLWQRVQGLS